MSSTRAQDVAEILWELKRAGKVAKYSAVARRAGFSPGSNNRAILTCLKNVRRDWPHLQWWRAVHDDGVVEVTSDQVDLMKDAGFEFEDGDEGFVVVTGLDEHLMEWTEEGEVSDSDDAEEPEEEAVLDDDDDDD